MNNQFSNIIEEFKWRGSLKDYTTNADSILINEKKYKGQHEYKNFKKAIEKLL